MGWKDNLEAQGRGAAQTLTGGWNDELVARLIQGMPQDDDGTGIPREYAGGQYEQYRDQQRADEADSQRKAPGNFATGQIAGALPATFATMALGGAPALGLGVAQGAVSGSGLSTSNGQELAKDTIRGAAVGGGLAAAGNAAQAAAPAIKALWRQGPPKGPALAHAGASARAGAPTHVPEAPSNTNFSEAVGEEPLSLAREEQRAREMLQRIDLTSEIPPNAKVPKGSTPTVRPGKPLVREAQPDLPGLPEPQYQHHATPVENAEGIAELGLRPEQGGKNFKMKKNAGRVYMSPPEEADMWARKLEDTAGQKALKLRTTAPAQQRPNSAKGLLAREEPVAPERIQYQNKTNEWRPMKELLPTKSAPPQGPSPDQLRFPFPGAKKAAKSAAQTALAEGKEPLGEGYTRIAVEDNGTALKLPKKPEGYAQNIAESNMRDRSPVLNRVIDAADDGSYVRQALAEPFDAESLAKHTGMPVIEDPTENWLRQMTEENFHGPQPTAEAQELQDRVRQVLSDLPELDRRDIGKPGQWGLNTKGEPVLLDYGFLKGMPLGFAGLGAAAASQNR